MTSTRDRATGRLPVVAGVVTALVLPTHLRGERLRRLTAIPDPFGPGEAAPEGPDCSAALRAGGRTLRLLARLRIPGWRSTCLYRSALHCLLLRRAGRPAVMRIGARRGGDAIEAHAWVEVHGEVIPGEAAGYAPFHPPAPTPG